MKKSIKTTRSAKSHYIRRVVKQHLNEIHSTSNVENTNHSTSNVENTNELLNCGNAINFSDESINHNMLYQNSYNYLAEDTLKSSNVEFGDISYFDENQPSNLTNSSDDDCNITDDEHGYYPSCSSDNEEAQDEVTLKELLICWSVKHNVTHSALSDLLKILSKQHPDLPKDSRTLLKTKSSSDIIIMQDMFGQKAEFVYFGLKHQLISLLVFNSIESCKVSLLFSIDGLPLYKSSGKQFWPILCSVTIGENIYKPFVVSIFCGNSKPKSSAIFLASFVAEFNVLKKQGLFIGENHFTIHAKGFVCDAPARAFVKCIKGHNGYYGCERCIQKGTRVDNRTVFPDVNAMKRTDASFALFQQVQHHKPDAVPPLLELNIGHISQFPLEYMHLVCLGATRRLLLHWLRGKRAVKISTLIADLISNGLKNLAAYVTVEFARKPRSLKDIDRWKATEFRLFLCYLGPLVLRSHLTNNLYQHFMLLHVAINILANPNMCWTHVDYAEKLLNIFVMQMPDFYGSSSINYTMHSLCHICDDVRQYGSLDEYSAFPFENALGIMKRLLRSGHMPLQQLCRRLSERINSNTYSISRNMHLIPSLKRLHSNGPTLGYYGKQYLKVEYAGFTYFCANSNNCALLDSGKVVLIENVIDADNIMIITRVFGLKENFYTYPCESSLLNIFKVSQLSDQFFACPITSIVKKCLLLPRETYFVSFALLHRD
nr:uncharacterized protein LOC124816627 isoform X1 [Hydra vulgaris]